MRGKHSYQQIQKLPDRITPADAGKTFMSRTRGCTAKDHPRGCGENLTIAALALIGDGSPPRMRGKRLVAAVHRTTAGITPADAGKTKFSALKIRRHRDHPRGCGENLPFRGFLPRQMGSPPRMRGKQF